MRGWFKDKAAAGPRLGLGQVASRWAGALAPAGDLPVLRAAQREPPEV
jgi:hypothetical protein